MKPAPLIRDLLGIVEAQEQLLRAYRLGSVNAPEKALTYLQRKQEILERTRAALAQGEVVASDTPQDYAMIGGKLTLYRGELRFTDTHHAVWVLHATGDPDLPLTITLERR